jgi:hypothetical protein
MKLKETISYLLVKSGIEVRGPVNIKTSASGPYTGALQIDGVAVNATAAEINQAADVSAKVVEVTALSTLVAADNGKVIFINNATGFVTTLPAPFLGARFTFINKTANTSGNHTVVSGSSANIIKGNQNSVAGDAGDSGTGDDTINFVANASLAGDKVELYSDGTSWFAYAISRVAAGITFTTAS